VYYVFGLLLLVLVLLLLVTLCVTIVGTYILLNGEDHRWCAV
jgi:transmembrane 9 superfamily protein 3